MTNPYVRFLSSEVTPYLRSRRKKKLTLQLREMQSLWRQYRCVPYHYFKHRLYESPIRTDVLEYVPPAVIERFQLAVNPRAHKRLLWHKLETNRAVAAHGVPCIETLYHVTAEGELTDGAGTSCSIEAAVQALRARNRDVFVKPIDDGVGNGASRVSAGAIGPELFARRKIVVQPRVENHPILQGLFPGTLNTIRVDTLLDGEECVVNAACLKIGTGAAPVDNWARGSIAVGIDLGTGALAPRGITKASFGRTLYEAHPVTGARFAGVRLPFWSTTLELARRAAFALRPHRSLGLDFAITPEGPLFVEANDTGDVFLLQEACGPLGRTRLCQRAMQHWARARGSL